MVGIQTAKGLLLDGRIHWQLLQRPCFRVVRSSIAEIVKAEQMVCDVNDLLTCECSKRRHQQYEANTNKLLENVVDTGCAKRVKAQVELVVGCEGATPLCECSCLELTIEYWHI